MIENEGYAVEKLDFYKHHIETSLIDIMNTRAQDNNFERQWIQLHVPNRDLQYAISQLNTLSLKLLRQIQLLGPVSETDLVQALDLGLGVISKNVNKLVRLGFANKTGVVSSQAVYQLSKTGNRVAMVQKQLDDLLDKQHEELVSHYTPEQLELVATFLKELQEGH